MRSYTFSFFHLIILGIHIVCPLKEIAAALVHSAGHDYNEQRQPIIIIVDIIMTRRLDVRVFYMDLITKCS